MAVTWRVYVNIGTRERPALMPLEVSPLPSGVRQVMVTARLHGAGAAARRYDGALRRRPLAAKRDAAWSPPPREVTSRVVGDGPARWWVCGPLAWDGEDYRRVVHTITGRHGVHAERARLRRRVVVTDARSGEELALWPPEPAAPAPLDEDDDDNAVEEGRAA